MNDEIRSLNLEDELKKLDSEINDYCLNVHNLSENEKKDIKELYKIWKSCLNKKIMIDNISNTNIRISNIINFSDGTIIWDDVKKHHSLHFVNCSNTTIIITAKVNHITFENCANINIRSSGGSISGIDIIRCNNITSIFDLGSIYFVDISNTTGCSFILSEKIAKDTIITTCSSYNIQFKTICDNTGITKNIYKTNMNIFQNNAIYTFHLKDGNLSLYITIPHSDNMYLIPPVK